MGWISLPPWPTQPSRDPPGPSAVLSPRLSARMRRRATIKGRMLRSRTLEDRGDARVREERAGSVKRRRTACGWRHPRAKVRPMTPAGGIQAVRDVARTFPGLRLLVLHGSRASGAANSASDWDFAYLGDADLDEFELRRRQARSGRPCRPSSNRQGYRSPVLIPARTAQETADESPGPSTGEPTARTTAPPEPAAPLFPGPRPRKTRGPASFRERSPSSAHCPRGPGRSG